MDISYILSFLLGSSLKVYDDFVDLKINNYPIIFDISKIIIILTTYLLIDEYYILSVIIFMSLIISNYCKKFDDPFWDAYMYFVGFLMIIKYKNIHTLSDYLSFKLIFILFIPVCIYFEEIMYTEEICISKLYSRGYSILINTFLILILDYFNILDHYGLEFFTCLIIFINSYFITNIIIQTIYCKYYLKLEEKKTEEKTIEEKKMEEK